MMSLGYFEINCYWSDHIEIKLGLGLGMWCCLRCYMIRVGYFGIPCYCRDQIEIKLGLVLFFV